MLTLCTLLLLVGCTESPIEEIIDINDAEFYAIVEGAEDTLSDTKTYIDNQIRMRWTAEDKIAMFKRTTYLRQYSFTGKTGANAGGFRQTSVDDEFWYGADVANIYAVYPYSENITLDETSCVLTLDMPAEQSYAENSFGVGANTMVAVSTSGQLAFKNVCSWLRVRLYGENTSISSITLTSLGEEAIAGEAEVTAILGVDPTCKMTGKTKSIKLTCATPVQISSSEATPTDFWIVVPPVTLKNGLSVTVEDVEGGTQIYEVNKSFTFERNKFYNLKREVENNTHNNSIPANEIWYTSIDGEIVTPRTNYFGSTIVSNVYEDGKGILMFNGDVTVIGVDAFYGRSTLTGITLPSGVTSIARNAFVGCTSLTSINLPDSVTSIGEHAFNRCTSLNSITLPNNLTSIGHHTFKDCTSLTSIILPDSVINVAEGLFYGCTSLTSIALHNRIKSIGNNGFRGCTSLKSIILPNSVTTIGDTAFSYCENLADIYSYPIIPPELGHNPFYFSRVNIVIHVMESSIDAYATSSWNEFRTEIVGDITE